MKRRDFLKTAVGLGLGGIFLNMPKRLLAEEETADHWQAILEQARWCPSVHNLQPQHVKIINAREAEIFMSLHDYCRMATSIPFSQQ